MAQLMMMSTSGGSHKVGVKKTLVFFFFSPSNGDGVMSFGLELPKHPCQYKFSRSVATSTSTSRSVLNRVYSSSSSSSSSSLNSNTNTNTNTNKPSPISSNYDYDYDYDYDDDDDDDDNHDKMDELSCFRGLVLDISYRPINVVCWKRAICLEFMDKADVLEYYDQTVNSPTGSFYIPAVLRVPHLLQVVKRRRIKSNLSRKNILYRDSYTCQYCSSQESLTIDHVYPAARGGEWKWENLVTACAKCNSKKGQKTLEEANMKLNRVPKVPKDYDILAIPLTTAAIKMLKMRQGTPDEWRQYLP